MAVGDWLVPVGAQTLLFCLLTGMAASVDILMLRERFRRCCGIVLGLSCQFLLLPLAGFCTTKLFDLEPVFGITLLAVTSSPGGAYSNWWCSLFNADLALSVAMTTCSTMVSIGLTPLNMALYTTLAFGEAPTLNWWKLLSSIFIAMAAIMTGLSISYLCPSQRKRFNVFGNIAGLGLIIFSVLVSSSDDPVWDKPGSFYIAVATPCLLGLAAAFGIGMASPCITGPEAVAVTVETSYQNTGLALTIALATFDEEDRSKAAGVPLFYGFVQVIFLPLFLLGAWRAGLTYAPRKSWLHTVILNDFQPRLNSQIAAGDLSSDEGTASGPVEPAVSAWGEGQKVNPLVGTWAHSDGTLLVRHVAEGSASPASGRLFCEGASPGGVGLVVSGLLWPVGDWHEVEERASGHAVPVGLTRLRLDEELGALILCRKPFSGREWGPSVLARRQPPTASSPARSSSRPCDRADQQSEDSGSMPELVTIAEKNGKAAAAAAHSEEDSGSMPELVTIAEKNGKAAAAAAHSEEVKSPQARLATVESQSPRSEEGGRQDGPLEDSQLDGETASGDGDSGMHLESFDSASSHMLPVLESGSGQLRLDSWGEVRKPRPLLVVDVVQRKCPDPSSNSMLSPVAEAEGRHMTLAEAAEADEEAEGPACSGEWEVPEESGGCPEESGASPEDCRPSSPEEPEKANSSPAEEVAKPQTPTQRVNRASSDASLVALSGPTERRETSPLRLRNGALADTDAAAPPPPPPSSLERPRPSEEQPAAGRGSTSSSGRAGGSGARRSATKSTSAASKKQESSQELRVRKSVKLQPLSKPGRRDSEVT